MSLRVNPIFIWALCVAGCGLSSEPGDRFERIDREEDAGLPAALEPTPTCRRAVDAATLEEARSESARFAECQGLVEPRIDCLERDRWYHHNDWENSGDGLVMGYVTYDCSVEAGDVSGTLSFQGDPLIVPERFAPFGSERMDELLVCEPQLQFDVGTSVDEVIAAHVAWIECSGLNPAAFEIFCAGPFRNEYVRADYCASLMCYVRDATGAFGTSPVLGRRPCE